MAIDFPRALCRLICPVLILLTGTLSVDGADVDAPIAGRIMGDRTNVRAKPSFDGEVLASLGKGSEVEILAETDGVEGEPGGGRKWFKIRLPETVSVWVYGPLVEPESRRVKGETLKYRAGPGRNYSELGELRRGEVVTEIRQSDGWIQIEVPAGAVAYVAASLVEAVPIANPVNSAAKADAVLLSDTAFEPAAPIPSNPAPDFQISSAETPPAPPTETAVLPEAVAPVVGESDPVPPAVSSVQRPAARAVVREGVIRRTTKLQAPGDYELRSVRRVGGLFNRDEGLLDFLVVEDPAIKLERFENRRVYVHGTEWRDERWRTPMLKVMRVDSPAY